MDVADAITIINKELIRRREYKAAEVIARLYSRINDAVTDQFDPLLERITDSDILIKREKARTLLVSVYITPYAISVLNPN